MIDELLDDIESDEEEEKQDKEEDETEKLKRQLAIAPSDAVIKNRRLATSDTLREITEVCVCL